MNQYNLFDMNPEFIRQLNLMQFAGQYDTQMIPFVMQQVKPTRAGIPRNRDLYKTSLCDHWCYRSYCPYGAECWFAHGPEELRIAQFLTRRGQTVVNSNLNQHHENNPHHDSIQDQMNAINHQISTSIPSLQPSGSVNSSFDRVIGSQLKKNKNNKELMGHPNLSGSIGLDSGIDTESKSSDNSKLDSTCSSYNLWDNSFTIALPISSPDIDASKKQIRKELGYCDFMRTSATCILDDDCCFTHELSE